MESRELLLAEYNNLWQEKIAHKASLRKLKGYVSYFTSIISGSLTIFGLSSSDIFKTLSSAKDAAVLAQNISNAVKVVSIPAVPIIMLLGSFALNELFQIYVIGNHIGNIEAKANKLLGCDIFSWEHKVCPVVYGGKKTKDGRKLTNVIAMNDYYLFFPFVGILTTIMMVFAINFLMSINVTICLLYAGLLAFLLYGLIRVSWKLKKYTEADSELSRAITEASSEE